MLSLTTAQKYVLPDSPYESWEGQSRLVTWRWTYYEQKGITKA